MLSHLMKLKTGSKESDNQNQTSESLALTRAVAILSNSPSSSVDQNLLTMVRLIPPDKISDFVDMAKELVEAYEKELAELTP